MQTGRSEQRYDDTTDYNSACGAEAITPRISLQVQPWRWRCPATLYAVQGRVGLTAEMNSTRKNLVALLWEYLLHTLLAVGSYLALVASTIALTHSSHYVKDTPFHQRVLQGVEILLFCLGTLTLVAIMLFITWRLVRGLWLSADFHRKVISRPGSKVKEVS
jgi:hypothetical protein